MPWSHSGQGARQGPSIIKILSTFYVGLICLNPARIGVQNKDLGIIKILSTVYIGLICLNPAWVGVQDKDLDIY